MVELSATEAMMPQKARAWTQTWIVTIVVVILFNVDWLISGRKPGGLTVLFLASIAAVSMVQEGFEKVCERLERVEDILRREKSEPTTHGESSGAPHKSEDDLWSDK